MPDREPDGWLDNVALLGSDEPVKVVLEERRGNELILRQVDPGEPTPPRIPMFNGDRLVVMTAVSHIGIHSSGEVGAIADLIHSMRVVPVRREGSTVYGRSLRLGEADDGQRIHIRPGDTIAFEAGAIVAELDAIDAREDPTQSGYVPLSGVLSAWFHIGSSDWPAELVRYALAAARRLDMTNELLIEVQSLEDEVNADPQMPGPQVRRRLFNVLGSVELAVISLGRGVSMILDLPRKFGIECDLPESLLTVQPALNAIRNAYEHIEDRALGTVHGTPSEDALTIFGYERLLSEDVITYGTHTLDLAGEVPGLLAEARVTLKGMVSTAVPPRVTLAE
ncbi:hypothetical protein [Ornithinimicrobium sediminis]|uniref:hypothetical protein n=1 Tax=Ornithinimicrobium sediminis TaxID=2904603 RepID=UPI001E61FBA4|nr:hypothetical protein [Ornithinimicrobium sediminis]MCE0485449.1 hypothetical protein [Ornithinimicrobium sediminis]